MRLRNKILIFLGGAMLILILTGFGLFYWKADDYIANQLSNYIQESSHQQYSLAMNDLKVSLLPPGFTALGLHLSGRDSSFLSTNSASIQPRIKIKELKIDNVSLTSFLFEGKFLINNLEITEPEISIISTMDSVANMTWGADDKSVEKEFEINTLNIKKGVFRWQQGKSSAKTNFDMNVTGLNLLKQDVQLDTLLAMFTETIYQTPDSLYRLKCDSISIDHIKGTAKLRKLNIEPLVDKYEIGHIKGHEADWVTATINNIDIEGMAMDQIFKDSISIRSLTCNNISTLVFRDKRLKFPDIPDKPMPNELIAKLKIGLNIDSIHISDADITYQEHVSGSAKAGAVIFKNSKAHGGPLSTATGSILAFDIQTQVMDKGLLKAHLSIPATLVSNKHTVTGTLHRMDLTGFNPMMNYLAKVNIESGIAHSLDFTMSHDQHQSNGQVRFSYEDLKIEFMDPGKGSLLGGLDDAVATFIANTFLIKTSNVPDKNMRIGEISFERNPKKSWFNYWWKSILSGIKSSTGIKEKK